MLPFLPPPTRYRRAVRRGDVGHEVYALQVLLNQLTSGPTELTEDGHFGELTEKKLLGFQRTERITADGIAGLETGRHLAKRAAARIGGLPPGLLMGLMEGESLFAFGAVNALVKGGLDLGLIQDRIYDGEFDELAKFRHAFGIGAIEEAGAKIRGLAHDYRKLKGCPTDKRAWETAIGAHNWPAAADKIAHGEFDDWIYVAKDEHGVKQSYGVDEDAWWVYRWGIPGVRTGRQWFEFYVRSKTHYVTSWPAP